MSNYSYIIFFFFSFIAPMLNHLQTTKEISYRREQTRTAENTFLQVGHQDV